MLRGNIVPIDFGGFVGCRVTFFRHEDSAHYHCRTVSQSARLRVALSGGSSTDPRAPSATHRLYAQVEVASAERPGSAVLVVDVKDLERLDIGADPRETGNRDPMTEEEVPGVLAAEVSG